MDRMTNDVVCSDDHKELAPDFQLPALAFTAHSVAVVVDSQPQQAALINPLYPIQHQTADDQAVVNIGESC